MSSDRSRRLVNDVGAAGGTDVPSDAARYAFLWRGVPAISARTMGQFRVVFGLLLFYVVFVDPPRPQPLELHRNYSWLADWWLVHGLAASAGACRAVHMASLAAILFFVAGLFTRPAYVAAVASILLSRLIELHQSGTHDWDLPLFTLAVMAIVPWGDGFSLDRWRARGALDERQPGLRYGLAIWIPGFMIGLAFAAAAYAKLVNGGLAWITSGAVRYHFVEDAPNAPLTWGLWVAAHPSVAILFSLGAVLIEGTFILNAFVRSLWARLAFGIAGLSLFAGFYVFQGVLWLPWLMLFIAFLPWPFLDRERTERRQGVPGDSVGATRLALRPWHAALIAILAAQQILASFTATQIEPLISDYPMYSSTFESPEAFERSRYRKLQRLFFDSGGTDVTTGVRAIKNAPENLLNAAEHLARGEAVDDGLVPVLTGIRSEYRARYGGDLDRVTVTAERVLFDWDRGEFKPPVRVRIAEVPLPNAATE